MPLLTCPNCHTGMQEMLRNQVAFDSCPQCRGIWLDRGELEKILSAGRMDRDDEHQERERPAYSSSHYPYRKKKHWVWDIFD